MVCACLVFQLMKNGTSFKEYDCVPLAEVPFTGFLKDMLLDFADFRQIHIQVFLYSGNFDAFWNQGYFEAGTSDSRDVYNPASVDNTFTGIAPSWQPLHAHQQLHSYPFYWVHEGNEHNLDTSQLCALRNA